MYKSKAVFRLTLVGSALLALCCVRPAMAGTTNSFIQINGYGKAYVSGTFVNSNGVSAGAAANSTFVSTNIYLPCASVNPKSFTCNVINSSSPLPSNHPPNTNYIQVSGTSRGTWINSHYITAGSSVDNPKFDERLFINPAPCSFFSMDSTMTTNNDGLSGVIIIQAKSDAGSGLWVRGIEYPQTATNADELIAHGSLKWDYIVAGPFEFSTNNCNALIIPFTTETGISNLYFMLDTVGKSIPFTLICPSNVVLACDASSTNYGPVYATGGCGDVTLSFNPPANAIQLGVTNIVTATATASDGAQATCTFNATRGGLTFVGFYSPLSGPVGTCASPAKSVKQGSNVTVKFDTKCGSSYFNGGPTPRVLIQRVDSSCNDTGDIVNSFASLQGNDWHFNWTATNSLGNYKVLAVLQDGSTNFTYVTISK